MSKLFPENVRIHISDKTIDSAKGCDPNHCAIKLEVKKAIGGHGYVAVDSTGIAITRRSDYREKSFMPRKLGEWMVAFDSWSTGNGPRPKPITAVLKFFKTTRIGKTRNTSDDDHSARLKRQRITRKKTGANKVYGMRRRIVGLAVATPKQKAA